MKKKVPDIIVWSEERGYYAKELSYGSDLGAPAIKADDVIGWRNKEVSNVNNRFKAKYEELKQEVEKLVSEYNWNDLIYRFTNYSFIPVIGEVYHLYQKEDESYFMSLIEPQYWNKKYIGSFRLDSTSKWIKL